MKLIWTKSNKPLSVLIRAITGEPSSHFSFVFESAAKGLMFESNLLGTHPAFLQTSLKTHTIVHEKNIPMTVEREDLIWDLVVQKYDGKGYDFLGALYLGLCKLGQRLFNFPMPTKNKWGQPDKFFCNEVYDVFNQIPGMPTIDVMSGMDTPEDVWKHLENVNFN